MMKPLPPDIPGPDNDLNELIHKYIVRAIAMGKSAVYAFGEKWGPEKKRDEERWVAIFLAFQSQCFHTDDTIGHQIPEVCDGEQSESISKRQH